MTTKFSSLVCLASTITYFLCILVQHSIIPTFGMIIDRRLDSSLDFRRNDCLNHCKTNTKENDLCHTNCLELLQSNTKPMKRNKRAVYDCPDSIPSKVQIGTIVNLGVSFTPLYIQDAQVWTANISWDIKLTNSSFYESDIWKGFLVFWLKKKGPNSPAAGIPNCQFNPKNKTWLAIENGTDGWVYPMAITTNIMVFPYYEGTTTTMETFSPKGTLKPTPSTTRANSTTSKLIFPTTKLTTLIQNSSNGTTRSVKQTFTARTGTEPGLHFMHYVAIGTGVFIGVIIMIITMVLYKKKQTTVTLPASDQKEIMYDSSILFSSHDEKFVTKTLIPFLEKKNNFKCFVHYRNWEPGKQLHENMAYSIYNCRKIIAVISRNFLESNYCQDELSMALERVSRCGDSSLIVINLDGVPLESLPEALRCRTFLDLSSAVEKKTWKGRLYRQISADTADESLNTSSSAKVITVQSSCRDSLSSNDTIEEIDV